MYSVNRKYESKWTYKTPKSIPRKNVSVSWKFGCNELWWFISNRPHLQYFCNYRKLIWVNKTKPNTTNSIKSSIEIKRKAQKPAKNGWKSASLNQGMEENIILLLHVMVQKILYEPKLPWPLVEVSSKFNWNLLRSFWVILLINKQTNIRNVLGVKHTETAIRHFWRLEQRWSELNIYAIWMTWPINICNN